MLNERRDLKIASFFTRKEKAKGDRLKESPEFTTTNVGHPPRSSRAALFAEKLPRKSLDAIPNL
jgi:hypothetical protein